MAAGEHRLRTRYPDLSRVDPLEAGEVGPTAVVALEVGRPGLEVEAEEGASGLPIIVETGKS